MVTFQRVLPTSKADKEGKSSGYCADCGCMLMYSDACCPKCQCEEVVLEAPSCKVGAKGKDKPNYIVHPSDMGNARR